MRPLRRLGRFQRPPPPCLAVKRRVPRAFACACLPLLGQGVSNERMSFIRLIHKFPGPILLTSAGQSSAR
jgi:hypothetical protein